MMTILPLLLFATLSQDPQAAAPTPPSSGPLDLVELEGGETLEGRILVETGGYLEIELEPGSVVGFRTTKVAAIRRGQGRTLTTSPVMAWPQRDQWFTLHDGSGSDIGWLHSTLTHTPDGAAHVQEEWEFSTGQRFFQVTVLETTDAALQPVSCYFRERVREEVTTGSPLDPLARRMRIREERIVEARIEGAVLAVSRLTPDGRSGRQLPWPRGATFPLLARQARAMSDQDAECTVFDAATEELQTRTFAGARARTVAIDGVPVRVEETVEQAGGTRNAVWRDADARVLRREIAGPALVAVPCSAEAAATTVGHRAMPAAFVAEPQLRFGLWRPNPIWDVLPSPAGTVALRSGLHQATITLSLLQQLDAGASLDAAADAVARWMHLLHPQADLGKPRAVRVRQYAAVSFESVGIDSAGEHSLLIVAPWRDRFVVLQCRAPRAVWDELRPDFDAVAGHLELVPAAVAALVPQDGSGIIAPVAAVDPRADAAAGPTAPAPRPVAPRVRVPTLSDDHR